ncbi:5529_t:CDS:2 [Funneliformis caledonium]|uniref:5529_t:CDS:1 n=1 Tax=Funneliformis caledonium TaxID=1117310 RepID=A0A9N8Z2M3_9GLOM|nr:5529_t:CDS:2 [Funneliformis caledonium]
MPTRNDGVAVFRHHNNDLQEQFHSIPPPTYEHNSTRLINNDNNNGLSSPPTTHSLLNSPVPSAPPAELILDDESYFLALPSPIANPNFRTFPNSNPNSSSSYPITNISPYQQHPQAVTLNTKQQQPAPTVNESTICKFLKPLKDKRNWFALIYLLLWDLNFILFSFMWIVFTFCISISMMIIPPIGYILLTWSVLSWRALAHLEFLAFNLVFTSSFSPSFAPILPPAHIPREPGQGYFDYLIQILIDGFTVRCFAYFVFIKPWVSLFATLCTWISFIIGLNFLVLPIFMPIYRNIMTFELKLGKRVLNVKIDDKERGIEV